MLLCTHIQIFVYGASTEYQISNHKFSDFLRTYYCDFLNNVYTVPYLRGGGDGATAPPPAVTAEIFGYFLASFS